MRKNIFLAIVDSVVTNCSQDAFVHHKTSSFCQLSVVIFTNTDWCKKCVFTRFASFAFDIVLGAPHLAQGFFGALFRKLRSQKNHKKSLKLSTSKARSNFCSIFLCFYYLKRKKTQIFPQKTSKFLLKNSAHQRPGASHNLPEGAQKSATHLTYLHL